MRRVDRLFQIVEIIRSRKMTTADYLGEKPFLMGAEVGSVDATVFAFVAAILFAPFPSPLKSAAENMENLKAYCERMRNVFFL